MVETEYARSEEGPFAREHSQKHYFYFDAILFFSRLGIQDGGELGVNGFSNPKCNELKFIDFHIVSSQCFVHGAKESTQIVLPNLQKFIKVKPPKITTNNKTRQTLVFRLFPLFDFLQKAS